MDMITPWDSLGMGSKLHVATDLDAILSLLYLSRQARGLTADQKSNWQDTHPRDTLISVLTCFMDMITPWDSLGMCSKLHVATDLDAILSR